MVKKCTLLCLTLALHTGSSMFAAEEKVVQPSILERLVDDGPAQEDLALIETLDVQALPVQSSPEDKKEDITLVVDEPSKRFLEPWNYGNPNELIEIEFDNAEISTFIAYIEKKYDLTFIMDDQLQPLQQGGKSAKGTKISFKTHKPLPKKQAWEIFVAFLDIAGLAVQPGPGPGIFRIASTDSQSKFSVYRGPLPVYIGVEPSLVPDNDTRIRYVYFVENTSVNVIKNVVDSMRSATSPQAVIFPELRAIVVTDRASNVKAMLNIIKELDKVAMPEVLSVIKLKRTDASKVAELYKSLMRDDSQNAMQARLLGGRKQATSSYFPEGTRVIADPQTNTLILLGTVEAIKRIEDFLIKEIDRELDVPFSPLHVYTLRFVDAESVAAILQQAVAFQPDSEAAKYGGVRDGNKYFKPISITAEKTGNRIVVNADYEDYLKIYDILVKLDVEQPQVAVKMLLVNVDVTNAKSFGTQLRNKAGLCNGFLGDQVNFQTSGLAGSSVIENPDSSPGAGAIRLLGNLAQIANNMLTAGSTVVTFGADQYGVWGILRALESLTKVSVIANPFLITTHKYPASVKVGEVRRVVTGTVFGNSSTQDSRADLEAKLEVTVVPQISYEGLITLDVSVVSEQFSLQADPSSGDRISKTLKTSLLIENNAVAALGGLVVDRVEELVTQVPILGDIPIVGWIFKNKTKTVISQSLVILISAEIIPPHSDEFVDRFTHVRVDDAIDQMNQHRTQSSFKDPVNRWFFNDRAESDVKTLEEFVDKNAEYIDPIEKERIEKEKKEQRNRSLKRIEKKMRKNYRPLTEQVAPATTLARAL